MKAMTKGEAIDAARDGADYFRLLALGGGRDARLEAAIAVGLVRLLRYLAEADEPKAPGPVLKVLR